MVMVRFKEVNSAMANDSVNSPRKSSSQQGESPAGTVPRNLGGDGSSVPGGAGEPRAGRIQEVPPAAAGDATPRPQGNIDLAALLPGEAGDLARSPGVDFRFATAYPSLWTVLSALRTRKGDPRAPGELRIALDGATWVVTLTMPEEELTLQAEAPELSDIWEALERRLSTRPIPWRKAGRYVRKKQLSPKKTGLTKPT